MPGTRWTAIFQYSSGGPTGNYLRLKGGWSESLYTPSYSSSIQTQFNNQCIFRANLLPANCYIAAVRVQQVDPTGSAQTYPLGLYGPVGSGSTPQDIPQMAALLRVGAVGRTNVRSMRIAAIPDAQVVYGELQPSGQWYLNLLVWLQALNSWYFRGQDLTQPTCSIIGVTSTGVYTLNAPGLVLTAGTKVKVKRTLDQFDNAKGGTYIVTPTSALGGTLSGWNLGSTTGGLMQSYQIVYPQINASISSVQRVVVRKVGRPLLGYRGRRSKKKP